jgi:hypothetical protein
MSTYSLQVPDGLKPHHCERPGIDYTDVPIRYIMTQLSEEEIRKTSIKLPDGNKLLVTVYSDENAELYLRMLRDHDNLMDQNGSKKAIEDAHADLRQTFKVYKTAFAAVNPVQERARIATLKQDWRAAQRKCRDIVTSAFSLFRRMLDATAKEQWDIIDTEVHSDDTHTDLKGLTVDGPKQRSWYTFLLCIEKHKLYIFKLDAADEQRRYLNGGVRKPFEVKIKWFVMRIMAMNRDLALMPCLATNTQTSIEVKPTNVPLNGAEMCGIIIRCLQQDWQTQYRMVNGQKNQTKVHELVLDLEAVEKVMDQKRKEKDASTKKDSAAKSPGKNEKGSGKRRSNGSSDSFRIPKKQRTEKFCNRCKDNGGAHTTHNTSDCNRYKADGTPNKEYGAKSGFSKKGKDGKDKSYNKGGWDKQSISHLTAERDSFKKKYKKLKKSLGKKRKRHSHHQQSESSSSGSDSE